MAQLVFTAANRKPQILL